MTKKDYIKAAKIVRDLVISANNSNGKIYKDYALTAATEVQVAFVKFFEEDNPRFDKQRFLAACNVESIK